MSLNINEEKVCPKCGVLKLRKEFYVENARSDKMSFRCKMCQSQVDKERHFKIRPKRLKQQRDWYKANSKERIKKAKDWVRSNPERRKATKRKNDLAAYGLTIQDFDALLAQQNNSCAICKGPPAGKYSVFVVDHDHRTNKVRGLLCSICNMGIGLLKDNVEVLKAAVLYLEQSG